MRNVRRNLAFVVAASNHGTMIVNRFDYQRVPTGEGYGVGHQILEYAAFDPGEIDMALQLLTTRRKHFGDGVVAIDCGANIGAHSVEWAIAMANWGTVLAIEAQERLFYALAGNIAINNCFNAKALHAAVAAQGGSMRIPAPDYLRPSSFGSLELKPTARPEYIGQVIDYSPEKSVEISAVALDDLALPRVDFIKIDIVGMEREALEGARATLEAHHPILLVESIKVDPKALRAWLEARGYHVIATGINRLAVHTGDPTLADLRIRAPA